MYYEIHGTGEPLILLHGGVSAIEMFGPNLPARSATRKVVAVDLQAHGRTADIDRPLSFELMGDDIAALITHLKIERANVMGYSLGVGVALQTASGTRKWCTSLWSSRLPSSGKDGIPRSWRVWRRWVPMPPRP